MLVLVLGQGLVFPLVGVGIAQMQRDAASSADSAPVTLAIDGDLARLSPYADANTSLVAAPDAESDASIVLSSPGAPFDAQVRYDPGERSGMTARKRAEALATRAGEAERTATFVAAGAVDPARAVAASDDDTISAADRTLRRAASAVPALLMMLVASGGIYTALDVVTGEKERRTVETLLSTAANRRDIAVAKFLVVLTLVVAAAFVSLTSLYLTSLTSFGASMTGGAALPVYAYVVSLALFLPLAATLAAILTAAAARVSDFKSGQVYAFPALVVPAGLAAVALLPDATLTPLVALIPISNLSVALREVLLGTARPGPLLLALVASTVYAGAALTATTRWLSREEVLLGDRSGGHRRLRGDFVPDALAVFAFGLAILWFVASPAQQANFGWGMALSQFGLFLPIGLLAPAFFGLNLRETLALHAPRPRDLAWGVLAGLLCPLVGLTVEAAQSAVMPMSPEVLRMLEGMIPDLPAALLLLLVGFAPGLCEEMMFRGAILGLLKKSLHPVFAVVLAAVAFGLFHLSLYRVVPTALLGLLFGFARIRSGSLVVAIVMHAMNNGLIVAAGLAGVALGFRPEMALAVVGIVFVLWRMGK